MTAEIVNLVAATAALGAVVVAALEYRRVLRERAVAERAELDGVAVQWHPRIRPNHTEPGGSAIWEYDIAVHNPGRLPIRDVTVVLTFPVDVQREHYDGALEEPGRLLRLVQPVIIGGGTRTWHRKLRLRFEDRERLHEATADVTFTPLRGSARTNHMDGRPPSEGAPA